MAKAELGTKRVCPTTGRKFYDMNKDPIVSPYTGQTFARSIFEPQAKPLKPEADDEDEADAAESVVELVPLEEADAETDVKDEAAVVDDIEVEDDAAPADDTFLEEDEEGDDDVADLIDGDLEDDEET